MLTLGEIQRLMSKLDNWSLEENSIVKVFNFTNFKEALEFLKKVGEAVEKLEHEPDVVMRGGSLRLSLSTHSEGGLTKKDFEAAEEIDKI